MGRRCRPGPCRGARRRATAELGSAVVEFAAVVPLLLLVVLAVVQVALALHVRATIQSAAAEGARVAAVSGGDTGAGVARTRAVLATSLADGVVESVTAGRSGVRGVGTVVVEVRARLPLVGMLGPTALVVDGHALIEG